VDVQDHWIRDGNLRVEGIERGVEAVFRMRFVGADLMLRRALVLAAFAAAACRVPIARAPERVPAITRVRIETSKGAFVLEVNREWAPRGADRVLELVRARFFDDSRFFRVREKYIAQFGIAGDPALTRKWDGKYVPTIRCAPAICVERSRLR
jgi:hypothetical protein